ncbi:MAG TPA: hypothetical protein VEZ11_18130, partial [Thermoanaerobaculia bacterium]|nr:hypothetical protein [Thermoanaerobaculia bacterium]
MLGDSDQGEVVRAKFHFAVPSDVPPDTPLVILGSMSEGGIVVKTFRYPLRPDERNKLEAIQTVPPGDLEVEARL